MNREKSRALVTHRDPIVCELIASLLVRAGMSESDVHICVNDPAGAVKELEERELFDLVVTQFHFGRDAVGREGIIISDLARQHDSKVIMISDNGERDREHMKALDCLPDAFMSDPPSADEVSKTIDSVMLHVHTVST